MEHLIFTSYKRNIVNNVLHFTMNFTKANSKLFSLEQWYKTEQILNL